jgi:cysteine protease ATG4
LHERYINSNNARALELKALNDRFAAAFESITWFSYRDNLEAPLVGSSHRSDTGWGCMLRTGQMILFQAVKRHIFGDHFHLKMLKDYEIKAKYCEMLKLFMDNCPPGPIVSYCPFGIHSIAAEGRLHNITPG